MNMPTSGSAYSVLALSLPMPRKVSVTTPWSPSDVAWKLGTRWVTSWRVETCCFSNVLEPTAVTARGVFCSGVARLVAVTMTSDGPGAAGSAAAAALAAVSSATAAAEAQNPSFVPIVGPFPDFALSASIGCIAIVQRDHEQLRVDDQTLNDSAVGKRCHFARTVS